MKKLRGLIIFGLIGLLFLTGCQEGVVDGSEKDFIKAHDAVSDKLRKRPAIISSALTMNFRLGENTITATSDIYTNILKDGSVIMKLPKGIDFGSIPVGQLGLENLDKEMIYIIKDDESFLFVEGKLEDHQKVNLDLNALYEAVVHKQDYEAIKDRIDNFVVVNNGDSSIYTYEIKSENAYQELSDMISTEEISKLEEDDISLLTTESIEINNKEVIGMSHGQTIMLNAGSLIGPEAGNIGKLTIDLFIDSDFRETELIEIPKLEGLEEKIID